MAGRVKANLKAGAFLANWRMGTTKDQFQASLMYVLQIYFILFTTLLKNKIFRNEDPLVVILAEVCKEALG